MLFPLYQDLLGLELAKQHIMGKYVKRVMNQGGKRSIWWPAKPAPPNWRMVGEKAPLTVEGKGHPGNPQLLCETINEVHLFQDRVCAFPSLAYAILSFPLALRKDRLMTLVLFTLPPYIILHHCQALCAACLIHCLIYSPCQSCEIGIIIPIL